VPEALATLEIWRAGRGRSELKWIVARCPICGRRHVHAAGVLGEDDPYKVLGHRAKHWIGMPWRPTGYTTIDEDPERTRRMLREAAGL